MDWKTRLKDEHKELNNRREKLLIFLGGEEYQKLDPREQEALEAQHDVMRAYEGILWRRLQRAEATGGQLMSAPKMGDAPKMIGLVGDGYGHWALAHVLEAEHSVHYILADIAEQRIQKLESALRDLMGAVKHLEPCPGTYERAEKVLEQPR